MSIPVSIAFERVATALIPRSRDWHKGLSGHVLIVGGEMGYSGAPRMAGEAALRVGAGLVSIATKPEHAPVMNAHCPELMCHGIHAADELATLLTKATIVILGPGLGQTNWSNNLWATVLQSALPCLVDADGLNILAREPRQRSNWVLTPHAGEAARLLNCTIAQVQQDRVAAAQELQRQYGGVVVLKGADTLIADETGALMQCHDGNPGMATAGMGDVLSGVIGSLMAQGLSLSAAAQLGVVLHARAGDEAAKLGLRGMLASDLFPLLRRWVNNAAKQGDIA
jgi:NAD(P)H-hydrate epimerase